MTDSLAMSDGDRNALAAKRKSSQHLRLHDGTPGAASPAAGTSDTDSAPKNIITSSWSQKKEEKVTGCSHFTAGLHFLCCRGGKKPLTGLQRAALQDQDEVCPEKTEPAAETHRVCS